jgi:hypothetical protein
MLAQMDMKLFLAHGHLLSEESAKKALTIKNYFDSELDSRKGVLLWIF